MDVRVDAVHDNCDRERFELLANKRGRLYGTDLRNVAEDIFGSVQRVVVLGLEASKLIDLVNGFIAISSRTIKTATVEFLQAVVST
jgi:hypothetical protein